MLDSASGASMVSETSGSVSTSAFTSVTTSAFLLELVATGEIEGAAVDSLGPYSQLLR